MDAATAGLVTNAVLLAVGVGVGLGAGYLLFPAIREAKVLREQLDAALKSHEEYRTSVDAHFRKTADLVGQMTRSYAAVYDHLAVGARTFCDDAAAGTKVPFGPLPGTLASPDIDATAESGVADAESTVAEPAATVADGAPAAVDAEAVAASAEPAAADAEAAADSSSSPEVAAPPERKGEQPA